MYGKWWLEYNEISISLNITKSIKAETDTTQDEFFEGVLYLCLQHQPSSRTKNLKKAGLASYGGPACFHSVLESQSVGYFGVSGSQQSLKRPWWSRDQGLLVPLWHLSYFFTCLTRPFLLLSRKTKSTTPSPDFELKYLYYLARVKSMGQSKLYFMFRSFPSLYFVAKKRVKTTIRKTSTDHK